MRKASDMMARHAQSSIYRLRPNHGVAFLDIEISASQLARVKACFVEERLSGEDGERTVLLPIDRENMFDDGAAWHPETFKPLGPDEAIWLSGHQGILPFIGHWLPLPYLRMMTAKSIDGAAVDQGPFNWVRVFIHAPDGPLHETSALKAVLAIDTQLAGGSRLDQRRYNAPSLEDVSLGSTFVLADDASQLATMLTETWLNDWLREILDSTATAHRFEQEHIARYLFLLKVLCEACPAPILRFASQTSERIAIEAAANELILDLSDDVGLAVLVAQETQEWSSEAGRSRVLPVRDLSEPTRVHLGPLPVRVEFDTAPFGNPRISRRSGRSNAFNWSSLVRIGEEAARIALRPNAQTGTTGSAALARHVHDVAPIAGMWRSSSDASPYGKLGPPTRNAAMQFLAENGELIDTGKNTQPALRPRFSRSSLLTLFIAELVLQAISELNAPRKTNGSERSAGKPAFLSTLRLSLPVSIEAAERDTTLARANESIDFVWRAQGWDADQSDHAPPKPSVELGLGGDFGIQLLYLHGQLNEIYGGDLAALVEDLNPVRKPAADSQQVVQFASVALGFSATRVVVADYTLVDNGSIRPRLVTTKTVRKGLDAIHEAIVDHCLLPAIAAALHSAHPGLPADAVHSLIGRPAGGQPNASGTHNPARNLAQRLEDKVLRPAARALLDIYSGSPSSGLRGVEMLTLAGLAARSGGRLEPLSDIVANDAAALGANGFQLRDVKIPYSRHTFRRAVLGTLDALLSEATEVIDVDQTDLIFVTSTYAANHDLRDLILSIVPISPHRLIVLDEQWNADQGKFEHSGAIGLPIQVGVLSTVIGQQRMLGYHGIASIEQNIQLESEVA